MTTMTEEKWDELVEAQEAIYSLASDSCAEYVAALEVLYRSEGVKAPKHSVPGYNAVTGSIESDSVVAEWEDWEGCGWSLRMPREFFTDREGWAERERGEIRFREELRKRGEVEVAARHQQLIEEADRKQLVELMRRYPDVVNKELYRGGEGT